MTKLTLIFGTRPQIIKCVPVVREIKRKKIDLALINTGQHYDYLLSDVFLEELRLPPPHYNLGIGSGSHSIQTGNIMIAVEKVLKKLSPHTTCLIPGDTNSAAGSALAAVKLKMPVIHLESGLRANQEFLPEEINRKIIDHISQLLLSPTKSAVRNLIREGLASEKVVWTGDTMYDLFLMEGKNINKACIPAAVEKLNDYSLLTLHREENTEDRTKLMAVLSAVKNFGSPLVFPIHPRTKKRLRHFGLLQSVLKIRNLHIIDPLGYHSMMKLMRNSTFVMTDSGGVQKEAFFSQVPCITLRKNTEWVETAKLGANFLVEQMSEKHILDVMRKMQNDRDNIVRMIKRSKNPFGDGKASVKVVEEILSHY